MIDIYDIPFARLNNLISCVKHLPQHFCGCGCKCAWGCTRVCGDGDFVGVMGTWRVLGGHSAATVTGATIYPVAAEYIKRTITYRSHSGNALHDTYAAS